MGAGTELNSADAERRQLGRGAERHRIACPKALA